MTNGVPRTAMTEGGGWREYCSNWGAAVPSSPPYLGATKKPDLPSRTAGRGETLCDDNGRGGTVCDDNC